ncbi:3-5 exonuclease [Naviculisporaceae sp. PSN 640]
MADRQRNPAVSAPMIVTTETDLNQLFASLSSTTRKQLRLFIDLEGQKLSRNGTLSLMTIHVLPQKMTYIIDIETLRDRAFTHAFSGQAFSDSILEDPTIPKYFWDVRNDADALYAHHGIRLAGVVDVQLFENASRAGGLSAKTYLRGLDICVEKDLQLKFTERHRFVKIKREVKAMMDQADMHAITGPAGNNIFAVRPLEPKIISYCANDVAYLPALYELYNKRIKPDWRQKAKTESAKRVEEACSSSYEPHSEKKKFGPWAGATTNTSSNSKSRTSARDDDDNFQRLLDALEDHGIEENAREIFGDYYNDGPGYDDWYDDEYEWPLNSRDAAWDDTFESCWEK